jgi:hypothetical protein
MNMRFFCSTLFLGVSITVAGTLSLAATPLALARSPQAAGSITMHLNFKGSYKQVKTLHATEHIAPKAPDTDSMGCVVLKHGPLTLFFVHAQVNSGFLHINSASITIFNYRSSVTQYGASSTPTGTGAHMSFEVVPPIHFFSDPKTVLVKLSNGGKSGTFAASKFPSSAISKAAGETVTGTWTCSDVKTVSV